ncbi:MAG: ABC transporter ATP-binding protein [Planctomycetia bacterium]|nr:MAG: ABC transporter ATP-binding protein [Planctomycetia bacterium]
MIAWSRGPGRDSVTVRLEAVSKSFGAKQAVQDVSLSLFGGEVFAFLGPNGAGKTTTLRMTCGLLRPDTGAVEVCGLSMGTDARDAKQLIAYLPDQPYLYDKLTGREFVEFTRELYRIPNDVAQRRLAELARRLDMDSFIDRLTEHYSHGMKQKVALAAALIHAPQVLVVDEPMVGLDPRTIRVMKTIFREIADAGGTVFMSTHSLDVAEVLADRIGILNGGRLVALGTMAELRAQSSGSQRLEDIFLQLTNAAGDSLDDAGRAAMRDSADLPRHPA